MKKEKKVFWNNVGVNCRHLQGTATNHCYKGLKCQWYLAILICHLSMDRRMVYLVLHQ